MSASRTAANDDSSRPVHPTAGAFFRALDNKSDDTSNDTNKQSDNIRKKSQTLGWRSRYSQAEWYPFVIQSQQLQARQVQRGEVEGTYGTGATVWPASMVLLKYLEKNPFLIQGKSVVDLGAGTGITSIAAAILGASRVVCTDGTASVVRLASDNVKHNSQRVGNVIDVREYSWGDGSLKETFDVVLVSDCVLPKLYPITPLMAAMNELMGADSVAIVSYEHRYFPDFDPRDNFRGLAKNRGLFVREVPISEQDPVYSVDDIEIWEVRRHKG